MANAPDEMSEWEAVARILHGIPAYKPVTTDPQQKVMRPGVFDEKIQELQGVFEALTERDAGRATQFMREGGTFRQSHLERMRFIQRGYLNFLKVIDSEDARAFDQQVFRFRPVRFLAFNRAKAAARGRAQELSDLLSCTLGEPEAVVAHQRRLSQSRRIHDMLNRWVYEDERGGEEPELSEIPRLRFSSAT